MKQYHHTIIALTLALPSQWAVAQTVTDDANTAYQQLQQPKNYNIPAGTLTQTLNRFAQQTGVVLVFDPMQTEGKTSKGISGKFTTQSGFAELLKGTGLQETSNDKGGYTLKKLPPPPPVKEKIPNLGAKTESIQLDAVTVRAKRFYEVGPLPGLGLTKEEIPGNVQSITAKEIKESHALSLTDLMNRKLQSVNVNDYQGNPFQMDVTYRGFTAGPQIGTPQGLSVFLDGIRVNEPFGDVVNWDMIPMNAIAGVDVFPGSNPIFGLNTLGGAFTLKTKDGFNNEGVDAEVLAGSYGRKQLQVEGGWNNGTVALFGAGNFFLEDGWRDNSPSKVNQAFGKASYRGDKLDLSLSTLLVQTDLVGNGLLPSEMYAQDRSSVYSSPDTTKNNLQQFQLSGSYFVNDKFTVTGQVYRRDSKRHSVGADVFTDYAENRAARRLPAAGEEHTCVFKSTNALGIPDYVLVPINLSAGEDLFTSEFINDYFANNGVVDLGVKYASGVNAPLPDFYAAAFKEFFDLNRNVAETNLYNKIQPVTQVVGPDTEYNVGGSLITEASYNAGVMYFASSIGGNGIFPAQTFVGENITFNGGIDTFYYSQAGGNVIKNYVFVFPPINVDKCQQDVATNGSDFPGPYIIKQPDGTPTLIDGFAFSQPGYIEGTPTAVITDNQIDQIVDGASIQFNWNLEHHKFMVGASIDSASADYSNTQQLGFLDASRNAYLAPDLAHPQFGGADIAISNNDFSGTNITKSLYFSETWTPVDTWHFNTSARYNETQTQNKIAARHGLFAFGVGDVINYPNEFDTCISDEDCANTPKNYRIPRLGNLLPPGETEKFSYYSLNPSLGATWQAKENLNLYANWAKGTRTPSVIELGCAFDKTPIYIGAANGDRNDPRNYQPKSLQENRQCTLPTTLSGDPYLPQIRATTYDVGMRGTITSMLGADNLEWNLGAYQTDLKDDIYFINVGNAQGFFDTVGKTRRRGVEAGISGGAGKAKFSLNYGLTDATFQDGFLMISENNSSSFDLSGFGQVIQVKPGDRMPGVPLHNLNASVSYEITDKWQVGLSAVVHSESFVRGNENNEHQKGVTQSRTFTLPDGAGGFKQVTASRQPTSNPGKVPGYATFNFQTSYKLAPEWTLGMQVNNLLDKEYFSAGRLGRNSFSPSILGAIGPDGYNHNSGDWLSTNFIAPSAPRAAWITLRYEFLPDKK